MPKRILRKIKHGIKERRIKSAKKKAVFEKDGKLDKLVYACASCLNKNITEGNDLNEKPLTALRRFVPAVIHFRDKNLDVIKHIKGRRKKKMRTEFVRFLSEEITNKFYIDPDKGICLVFEDGEETPLAELLSTVAEIKDAQLAEATNRDHKLHKLSPDEEKALRAQSQAKVNYAREVMKNTTHTLEVFSKSLVK